MSKRAFVDASGLLTAWGYAETNNADAPIEVADDFELVPGGWRWDGTQWSAVASPVVEPARIVSSDAFRQLFTPAQTAALWAADPLLLAGMLKVLTQGTANLDSPEATSLLSLGVAKGALTESEKARILSGTPPAADPQPAP